LPELEKRQGEGKEQTTINRSRQHINLWVRRLVQIFDHFSASIAISKKDGPDMVSSALMAWHIMERVSVNQTIL
jgi:hypothetical protein